GQAEFSASEREVLRRQHTGHRRARPNDVRQSGAAMIRGRKVAGSIRDEVMTHDTQLLNSVVKLVKGAGFELLETVRYDTTEASKMRFEYRMCSKCQSVHHDMRSAKERRVIDHVVEREPHCRIIRGNDRTGARAHDDVNRHVVALDLAKDPEMRGTSKPA